MANIETVTVGDVTYDIGETNPGNHYSTTEKIVGTWIDGKPIYQKTVVGTMPAITSDKGSSDYVVGANIDTVIDTSAMVISSSEYWAQKLTTMNDSFTSGAKILVYNNSGDSSHKNRVFIFSTNAGWTGLTCYITIQYTKS